VETKKVESVGEIGKNAVVLSRGEGRRRGMRLSFWRFFKKPLKKNTLGTNTVLLGKGVTKRDEIVEKMSF